MCCASAWLGTLTDFKRRESGENVRELVLRQLKVEGHGIPGRPEKA